MFVEGEPHLQLEAVRVAASGVGEMDGARALIFVPRADVVRLEARYGSGAERPLVSLLLGLVLLVVAVLPVVMFVNAWRDGLPYPHKAITAFAFILPAAWLLNLSLRKRWFVCVHQRRGSRKLLFPRNIEGPAVHAFVENARSRFGY
jgi:hypothetical protein